MRKAYYYYVLYFVENIGSTRAGIIPKVLTMENN